MIVVTSSVSWTTSYIPVTTENQSKTERSESAPISGSSWKLNDLQVRWIEANKLRKDFVGAETQDKSRSRSVLQQFNNITIPHVHSSKFFLPGHTAECRGGSSINDEHLSAEERESNKDWRFNLKIQSVDMKVSIVTPGDLLISRMTIIAGSSVYKIGVAAHWISY